VESLEAARELLEETGIKAAEVQPIEVLCKKANFGSLLIAPYHESPLMCSVDLRLL
jgi:8-oxo-dGTP pyrophosphatase MutT (NUDIX family)